MHSFRSVLGRLFTNDEEVAETVAGLVPLSSLFQLIDCYNSVSCSIIKGLGLHKYPAVVSSSTSFIIGIPIGTYFSFSKSWGLFGLWTGLIISALLIAVLNSCIILFNADYHLLSESVCKFHSADDCFQWFGAHADDYHGDGYSCCSDDGDVYLPNGYEPVLSHEDYE